MVLGWKHPDKTGGAEITGYYVNYREVIDGVPGEWREANIKAISDEAYKISNLKENMVYQFQVAAMNIAGLGAPSAVSASFKCEEWTIAVPGPPHSLKCSEVRKTSLVLQWKPPTYSGRTPVTGYFVDIKEAKAKEDQWRGLNEAPIKNVYLRVQGLKEGVSYVFRVRAMNQAGVGKPSDLAGPVVAETRPGTKEVVVNVDDDGIISLNFECDQMAPNSEFTWSKDYVPTEDSPRLEVESKGNKTKMTFKDLGEEDLGLYSCDVTDTDGIASSYLIDEEELKRLLALSQEHKFPTVPVKSELAVEILEKGQVRFWMQAEKLSGNAKVNFIFNDKEIFEGPFIRSSRKKLNSSGKNGSGNKVANIKKETHIVWYKDDREISVDEKHDFKDGICTLLITEFSKKDAGIYEVILKDDRGKDKSRLKLVDEAFKELMTEVCKAIALSATNLKIQSTAEGIRLYSLVTYYVDDLKVNWSHNGNAIKYSDRVKNGVTGEQIWLQINEPTPNDKGKYVMELFDGKTGHQRMVDLSGQDRARVVGGLPDVVTIQEGKALNLTCIVWGDPTPEVSWLKNEKPLASSEHCSLKFEAGKTAYFTISAVMTSDSGKYGLVVKNKYGSETSDFTVSVFIPEEEARKAEEPQKGDKKSKCTSGVNGKITGSLDIYTGTPGSHGIELGRGPCAASPPAHRTAQDQRCSKLHATEALANFILRGTDISKLKLIINDTRPCLASPGTVNWAEREEQNTDPTWEECTVSLERAGSDFRRVLLASYACPSSHTTRLQVLTGQLSAACSSGTERWGSAQLVPAMEIQGSESSVIGGSELKTDCGPQTPQMNQ
ncbi:myomesin-2 [Camelus ferus]|nr:myomesin-2 [Camelus ferus]